ncbi:circadian clock KaiB family protein [Puia sp. P3]|uniref:circadian clock KaiB family protein n=1 Tax=Puia sp. P3 TaxID=3423952 RepID=UPI003D66CFBC
MENDETPSEIPQKLILQLFVSGMSPKSMEAIENARRIFNESCGEFFQLEIVDIYKNPEAALSHHVVFTPSLIKSLPLPKKILIGNLSDEEKVIKALGITFK